MVSKGEMMKEESEGRGGEGEEREERKSFFEFSRDLNMLVAITSSVRIECITTSLLIIKMNELMVEWRRGEKEIDERRDNYGEVK